MGIKVMMKAFNKPKDIPSQVPPLTPGTNKKMAEALKATFASWEKEQLRLGVPKDVEKERSLLANVPPNMYESNVCLPELPEYNIPPPAHHYNNNNNTVTIITIIEYDFV
ncbi:hypothetical protein SFRURICE_016360 [Spodoptera frugiperda]|nr:hypothetical protein SFRURICE_016360 [Spodoptera frugiperda]